MLVKHAAVALRVETVPPVGSGEGLGVTEARGKGVVGVGTFPGGVISRITIGKHQFWPWGSSREVSSVLGVGGKR